MPPHETRERSSGGLLMIRFFDPFISPEGPYICMYEYMNLGNLELQYVLVSDIT
jgi:hypothetical protein